MQKILLTGMLIAAAQACAGRTQIEYYPDGGVLARREIVEEESGRIVSHGAYALYYPNGKTKVSGAYLNGVEHGVWRWYRPDGTLVRESAIASGTGVFYSVDDDGNVVYEMTMRGGRDNAAFKSWYPNGQLKLTGEFKNGQPEGTWTKWNENGGKNFEREYADNLKTGTWKTYFDDNKPESEIDYVAGNRHGRARYWYKNGTLRRETFYREGIKHGIETYWRTDGKIMVRKAVDAEDPTAAKPVPEE